MKTIIKWLLRNVHISVSVDGQSARVIVSLGDFKLIDKCVDYTNLPF